MDTEYFVSMSHATITMKPREELRIRRGHPWIYDNEIAAVQGNPQPGDEVRVLESRGKLLGFGFFNPVSKIRVRLFSKTRKSADAAFFRETFEEALALRARFFDINSQSVRIIFGEADSVPGLVADLFVGLTGETRGRWITAQFLSLGVEKRKKEIIDALVAVFKPNGILEKSDAPVRALEGLEPATGILWGSVPEQLTMEENGARFSIDLAGGQKTGWFLDQRANRAAAARLAKGRTVLDAFCNQGGFGILCAREGATAVTAIDSSAPALAAAAQNAVLNGVSDRYQTLEANAFDALRVYEKENRTFDMVILDPPAFAKSRSAVDSAHRGYKEINVRAMRLLPRGGILVTCSCSYWFDGARFDSMLMEAAADCGRSYRVIEERTQDLDHPIMSGYGESRYLKCRIVEVL